jgi:magnesium transporter
MRNNSKSHKKIKDVKKSLKKVGEPPGTLTYAGKAKKRKTKITIIDYNINDYQIREFTEITFNLLDIQNSNIRWILVDGLENIQLIEELGQQFNLHPLILEDILNPNQTPKFEDYKQYIFIVLKRVSLKNEEKKSIDTEQICFILGKNYVLTFREQHSEIFKPIIERIKIPKGRIREMSADYLTYALIDILVDNYFLLEDKLGGQMEEIEDILIDAPDIETLQDIYLLKRIIIDVKKSIWPLRDVVNKLQREESDLIGKELDVYLRDVYDHIFRINDSLQNYRDIISGMLDMYLSSVSNKMNDIMKVLTIISTIFIPLSFLAGLYGMNFAFMPELQSPFGYPILLSSMFAIATIMLVFFKRKNWI